MKLITVLLLSSLTACLPSVPHVTPTTVASSGSSQPDVTRAERAVKEAAQALDWLRNADQESNHEANATYLLDTGRSCTAALDAVPSHARLEVALDGESRTFRVDEARTQFCDKVTAAGTTFAADVRTAKAERHAKVAGPYEAAGITGDRLQLLVDHDGYAFYGVGGAELTTPAQKKRAKVLFEVVSHEDPATGLTIHTVRRYEFRGDALLATTSEDMVTLRRVAFR